MEGHKDFPPNRSCQQTTGSSISYFFYVFVYPSIRHVSMGALIGTGASTVSLIPVSSRTKIYIKTIEGRNKNRQTPKSTVPQVALNEAMRRWKLQRCYHRASLCQAASRRLCSTRGSGPSSTGCARVKRRRIDKGKRWPYAYRCLASMPRIPLPLVSLCHNYHHPFSSRIEAWEGNPVSRISGSIILHGNMKSEVGEEGGREGERREGERA